MHEDRYCTCIMANRSHTLYIGMHGFLTSRSRMHALSTPHRAHLPLPPRSGVELERFNSHPALSS